LLFTPDRESPDVAVRAGQAWCGSCSTPGKLVAKMTRHGARGAPGRHGWHSCSRWVVHVWGSTPRTPGRWARSLRSEFSRARGCVSIFPALGLHCLAPAWFAHTVATVVTHWRCSPCSLALGVWSTCCRKPVIVQTGPGKCRWERSQTASLAEPTADYSRSSR